jgi:hypothetical protein
VGGGDTVALEDGAAGSDPHGMSRAIKLLEWEGVRREDLRVLTTRTNSQTANGVSWSPVLNADHQLLVNLGALRDVPLVAYLMSSPVRSDIPKSQSSGVTTTSYIVSLRNEVNFRDLHSPQSLSHSRYPELPSSLSKSHAQGNARKTIPRCTLPTQRTCILAWNWIAMKAKLTPADSISKKPVFHPPPPLIPL